MALRLTPGSGVVEHTVEWEWRGSFAFANIGMAGSAFTGKDWYKKHNPALKELFTGLLNQQAQGLLLNEFGNMSNLTTIVGKKRLEEVMILAFEEANAMQHGPPQFFWTAGETMAAFRADIQVYELKQLTNMPNVDEWRTVDRFEVVGATKYGDCSLLIYNQHQPQSENRRFNKTQRISFCTAVLHDAIRFRKENKRCIGYCFGGDANCSYVMWNTALTEVPQHKHIFRQSTILLGRRKKPGDLMVAAGINENLRFIETNTSINGREQQHDPMIMEWCYSPCSRNLSPPRNHAPLTPPASSGLKRRQTKQWTETNGRWKRRAQASNDNDHAPPANAFHTQDDNETVLEGEVILSEALGGDSGAKEHVVSELEGVNLLIESFLGSEYRAASQVPIAPPDTDLGMPENEKEIESDTMQHCGNAEPRTDDIESEVDWGKGIESDDECSGDGSDHEELVEQINAIGFALVQSSAMLSKVVTAQQARYRIDNAASDIIRTVSTKSDVQALEEVMLRFFTRLPVEQSTPPRSDKKAGRVIKTSRELEDTWNNIMQRRRWMEPNDNLPINDSAKRAEMYRHWMHDWMANEQTEQQRLGRKSQQSSSFAAYLYNNFGNKHFVMALWQTGVQWVPTQEIIRCDPDGAIEYVAQHFASWTQRLARSLRKHKEAPNTVEARRRSGDAKWQHGLTAGELQRRNERKHARQNYHWAKHLERRLIASKGNGKGYALNNVKPMSKAKMSPSDWWYLNALWEGELEALKVRAESRCQRVQADDFVLE